MLGPVFQWELVRSGRQPWHWWARVLYVGLLLFFLAAAFGDATRYAAGTQSHQMLAKIGQQFYGYFSLCQLLAVLLLAPIYAATSISEEKTRQTLQYLLTTQLREAEIVLSKIGMAVFRVWEVLLCGLPLCALSLLLGGVSPEAVLLDFLLALATAWASCALGVLWAVCVRRLVDVLFRVFAMQFLWYALPAIDWIARTAAMGFYIPRELQELNPFLAMYYSQTTGMAGAWELYAASLAGTGLCALVWSLLACRLLRPAWRRETERGGQAINGT